MTKVLRASGMKKCIGCFSCMLACSAVNQHNHSISKSAIKIATKGGLSSGFRATVCMMCKGQRACAEACPSGALISRKGGGVIVKKENCIGCRRCVSACIAGAIGFDEENHLPIICKNCSICTQYCPHKCLVMEETDDAE